MIESKYAVYDAIKILRKLEGVSFKADTPTYLMARALATTMNYLYYHFHGAEKPVTTGATGVYSASIAIVATRLSNDLSPHHNANPVHYVIDALVILCAIEAVSLATQLYTKTTSEIVANLLGHEFSPFSLILSFDGDVLDHYLKEE